MQDAGTWVELVGGAVAAAALVFAWRQRRRAACDRRRLAQAQRAQAQRALAEQAERFDDIEKLAAIGSWRVELPERRLIWSAQHFALFGLAPGGEVDLAAAVAAIHADDRPAVMRQYEAVCSDGTPMDCVFRVLRPDGTERVLHARARAEFDGRGALHAIVGTAADITERHEAARRLAESERRYRLLFEHNPLPMWTYDKRDWRITDVNQTAREIYGYTREQFLARNALDMHPPEEHEPLAAMLKARRGQPGREDRRWHHVTASGEVMAVDIYGEDAPFHALHCRIVCIVDRTAEEKALLALHQLNVQLEAAVAERTEELARREEYYRALADLSPQVIWQADAEGGLTYVNRAWHEVVGERPDGWLGWRWFDALHSDDLAHMRAEVERGLRERTRLQSKYRLRDRSGAYRNFLGVAAPLLRTDGSVASWIGVSTDISELERQARRLERLNAELETFSYSVSHDLRAPVQVIKGFLDAVLDGQAGSVDAAARDYLERALRNACRMDELISNMLKLASLSREPMQPQRFDVAALMRELVVAIQERHPRQVVECWIPARADIVADRRMIQALLENLMDNAVKFSRERAVCRIEFTVHRDAGHAILSLSDEGVGFPPEHAHRLFKPFQRLHAKKQFAGAGIGLAIVERIAALHGGSVSGRNREAAGAVFEVKLPLVYCGEQTTAADGGSPS
jgi:PAS domain S-box-containing protein